ncbi:hypothetical protein LPJ53_006213 [Coemansia erecta]|uniref:Uncharacterized protein n=1 Tax=Coemansia erecta TaxID=147472 RepID=A0A9W7XUG9_9FUNG|nr:hypothetical protein LPJ53_006213 [Coemansia erecta]
MSSESLKAGSEQESQESQRSQDSHDDCRRLTRSADELPLRTSNHAVPSLPNIVLGTYPREIVQKTYADLYAASYSDSESDDSDTASNKDRDKTAGSLCAPSTGSPPIEAKVLRFQTAAPRLPVVRVGAARLSEMMMYNRRTATEAAAAVPTQPDPADNGDGIGRQKSTRKAPADRDGEAGADSERAVPAPLGDHIPQPPDNMSLSSHAGCISRASYDQISVNAVQIPPTLIRPGDMQEGDEYNGLLAPGAYADDKQKAKADGKTPFHALLQLLRRNDADAEANMFKPVVLSSGAKKSRHPNAEDPFAVDAFEETDRDQFMSKFPFCCCPAKYCVAVGFVVVLVGALLGFFVWPRMPTISINSLTPLAPASITYDMQRSLFGIHMPLQVSYEIHSGNFYKLQVSRIHVLGFDGVTGNKIIDTTVKNVPVKPLRLQFHRANTAVHYLTSDMADPALVDLFGKCAPRSALRQARLIDSQTSGRPGALTIRFQIKVNVVNLGWITQPIVTLNQNVNCPE